VRLLLDTHVWLWTLVDPDRLSREAADLIEASGTQVFLSAASSWEIAIKYRLGRLALPEPPEAFIPPRLLRDDLTSLPVEHHHACRVASLPLHHCDPFDRLLIAQAQIENMPLATADPAFEQYDVTLIPAARRRAHSRT